MERGNCGDHVSCHFDLDLISKTLIYLGGNMGNCIKSLFIALLLLQPCLSIAMDGSAYSKFDLRLSGTMGAGVGQTLDDITGILTPSPDNVQIGDFGVSASFYPLNNLGFDLGYDFYGRIQAYKTGYEVLNIFNDSTMRFGVSTRFRLFENDVGTYFLKLMGGLNFSRLSLHSDFTGLFGAYSFLLANGSATGLGYYGGLDINYKMGKFIMGAGLTVDSVYAKFEQASSGMKFYKINIPVYLGVSF